MKLKIYITFNTKEEENQNVGEDHGDILYLNSYLRCSVLICKLGQHLKSTVEGTRADCASGSLSRPFGSLKPRGVTLHAINVLGEYSLLISTILDLAMTISSHCYQMARECVCGGG